MTQIIDLTGRRFGALVVQGRSSRESRATYWVARCDCGALVDVESQNLRRGFNRSCGGPGCRGRYPSPDPATALGDMVQRGALGTTAALLRASIDDDHLAIRDLVMSLDEDDDMRSLLLHLLRIGTVALVKAEGSPESAHLVVDSLAAMDRARGGA